MDQPVKVTLCPTGSTSDQEPDIRKPAANLWHGPDQDIKALLGLRASDGQEHLLAGA